jgi:hypothetical protein
MDMNFNKLRRWIASYGLREGLGYADSPIPRNVILRKMDEIEGLDKVIFNQGSIWNSDEDGFPLAIPPWNEQDIKKEDTIKETNVCNSCCNSCKGKNVLVCYSYNQPTKEV